MKWMEIANDFCPKPGSGSRVEHVPAKDDLMTMIANAGFHGIRLLKYDNPPCFVKDGVAMRETHVEGWKAAVKGI